MKEFIGFEAVKCDHTKHLSPPPQQIAMLCLLTTVVIGWLSSERIFEKNHIPVDYHLI